MDLPGSSDSKESSCNAGDLGSIPGLRRFPGGRHGNPFQYSCLENPHGHRSLEGCGPWGHKELDTTEWLSTHNYEKPHILPVVHLAYLQVCGGMSPLSPSFGRLSWGAAGLLNLHIFLSEVIELSVSSLLTSSAWPYRKLVSKVLYLRRWFYPGQW